MNAHVKLGLLQREGCTAIRVTGWLQRAYRRTGGTYLAIRLRAGKLCDAAPARVRGRGLMTIRRDTTKPER
jgi:hypothetical protein